MKASTGILTSTQAPFFIFGIPTMMLVMASTVAGVAVLFCILLDLPSLMVILPVTCLVLGSLAGILVGHKNPHVETDFALCNRFWGLRFSGQRWLLSGAHRGKKHG